MGKNTNKPKIILFVCGSFNPPTLVHLRMFGKFVQLCFRMIFSYLKSHLLFAAKKKLLVIIFVKSSKSMLSVE